MLEAPSPAARSPRRPEHLTSAADASAPRPAAKLPAGNLRRRRAPATVCPSPGSVGSGRSRRRRGQRVPQRRALPGSALGLWFASHTDVTDGVSTNSNPQSCHATVRNSTATSETNPRTAAAAAATARGRARAAASRAAARWSRIGGDSFLLSPSQGRRGERPPRAEGSVRRWAGVSPRTRRLAPPSAGHSVCAKGLDFRPSASSPTPRAHGELHGGGTAPPPGKRWEQHLTLGARRPPRGRVSSGAFVPAAASSWRRPAADESRSGRAGKGRAGRRARACG